jgi:hypothetical protein
VAEGIDPRELVDRPRRRVAWGFVLGALAVVIVPLVVARLVSQPDARTFRYEIPPGTAVALASGEPVTVLPASLRLRLRDTLVVVNRDDRVHRIGPFRLEPGGLLQRGGDEFASFSGYCSLHQSGRIDVEIER